MWNWIKNLFSRRKPVAVTPPPAQVKTAKRPATPSRYTSTPSSRRSDDTYISAPIDYGYSSPSYSSPDDDSYRGGGGSFGGGGASGSWDSGSSYDSGSSSSDSGSCSSSCD